MDTYETFIKTIWLFGLLAGLKRLVSATEMAAQFVPDSERIEPRTPKPGQFTRIAVLCAPDFDHTRPFTQCLHWIPAWSVSEIDNAEAVFQGAVELSRITEKKLLDGLVESLKSCNEDDEVEVASVKGEIRRVQMKYYNLINLQCELYEDHKIICRDVVGDGNCGVEMLMNFTEHGSHLIKDSEAASRQDILPVLQVYRNELRDYWLEVRSEKFWQTIWNRTSRGVEDLEKWASENMTKEMTPEKRKCRAMHPDLPFTPDKREDARGLLNGKHRDPLTEVIVPAADDSKPASRKRKPTGKSLEPEAVITFRAYFVRTLGERGLTYRSWLAGHKTKEVVMVYLDLMISICVYIC